MTTVTERVFKQYELPDQSFDGADPNAELASALGSDRGVQTVEQGSLQSGNYAAGSAGWRLTPRGAEINGEFFADSGEIGGFVIGADYLRDAADSMGLASVVTGGDDVRFWAGATFANRASAPFRVTEAGVVYATSLEHSGGSISGVPISGIPNNSSTDISLLEKTHTMTFSVTDNNTIAWSSGTITLSNGRTFSINSGNTGNMAALTYIYLDPAVSSTALQTTTTASTAMGANKVLIGTAQNNSVSASYIPYGPGQPLVDGANIGALSITASQIAASTITAAKLSVSTLSAITADLGTITAGTVTGATIRTAASGTRFQMTSTSFQGINSSGVVIFEIVLSGGSAGDVIFGNDASGNYAIWDNSASEFNVFGGGEPVFTSNGNIGRAFEKADVNTLSVFDGQPRAVAVDDVGNFNIAFEGLAAAERFIGFCFGTQGTATRPTLGTFQSNSGTNNGSFSYTAGTGNNRAVLVIFNEGGSTNNGGMSSITYNSNSMTLYQSGAFNQSYFGMAILPIGSGSSSSQTININVPHSSVSWTTLTMTVTNVNQLTPVMASGGYASTSGGTITLTGWESLVVSSVHSPPNVTNEGSAINGSSFAFSANMSPLTYSISIGATGGNTFVQSIALQAAVGGQTIDFFPRGQLIPGFSGLTIGADYYLSNATAGAITTTPGSIWVGVAISATELITSV